MGPIPKPSATPTALLLAWRKGDREAFDRLVPLVHEELRRLAHHYMGHERRDHTLQATALVNEAYLRLIEATQVEWQSRAHFVAIAARIMRHILVDAARARGNQKRGGGKRVTLDEAMLVTNQASPDVIDIDRALTELGKMDQRKAQMVELRFFGGLSLEETAEAMNVSVDTVKRDWRVAKLWLLRQLRGSAGKKG
jgi:RNA polymerase sigma-70 factor (ECF subfamily)